MNIPHHRARLTVYSREQSVARVQAGQRAAVVAEAFGVAVRIVRKWLARFRAGGRAALSNRESAPAGWQDGCRLIWLGWPCTCGAACA